ncbi:MAG: hypothetical protein DRG24_03355 [Epsilonproteobacteria bacterium]|nr:MAG: hypothetical protein DRG24_03355 [Campylobacterota bacterium]
MINKITIASTFLMAAFSMAEAYSVIEDTLMERKNYTVDGSFGQYHFSDTDSSFNWAYTTMDKKTYQLKGTDSSDQNVFGWKATEVKEPKALWYMFALEDDVDNDGSEKYDWVLVSTDMQYKAIYKLEGMADNGTFKYGEKLNLSYQVGYENGEMKIIFDQENSTALSDTSSSSASSVSSALNDEQKYTLAYMWNEEKLAKDIYLALNEVHPAQVLYNIPTNSETKHQAAVEDLIKKYDINITNLVDYTVEYSEAELRAFAPGQYGITAIQDLYDVLYLKGTQSMQDAYEVGCMVEVTDIDDLDKYLEMAEGVEDLMTTFNFLRDGSYTHYWAFDGALKNMGVSDGCCVLGDFYCKTAAEYPQNSTGNGQGSQGQGNGKGGH